MVDETIVTGQWYSQAICTVNKSDNLHSQLYIALRPYRLPVHNKLPAGSSGVYYRDGCPATCGETKNGADDETITCPPSLQLVTYPASATAQSAEFPVLTA